MCDLRMQVLAFRLQLLCPIRWLVKPAHIADDRLAELLPELRQTDDAEITEHQRLVATRAT